MVARMNAADIRAALRTRWGGQEATIIYEVAQGTGTRANRHLDAVAMELWPSRGLALHGIEIKVSTHDWRREKKDPAKAEEIARFCDYFWIAAPPDVVPLADVPLAWGLLIVRDGKCEVAKAPEKTAAEPVSRHFLAACLRAATRPIDPDSLEAILKKEREAMRANYDKDVKNAAERMQSFRAESKAHWEKLIAALGEDPGSFYDSADVIEAVRVVWKSGVARTWSGLRNLQATLQKTLTEITDAAGTMNLPANDAGKAKRRRA